MRLTPRTGPIRLRHLPNLCFRLCGCRDPDVTQQHRCELAYDRLWLASRYLSTGVNPVEPAIPNAAHRLSYGQSDVAEKILGPKLEKFVLPSQHVKHNATALKP